MAKMKRSEWNLQGLFILHDRGTRHEPKLLSLLSVSESSVSSRACNAERGRLDDISMQVMGQEAE